MGRQYCCVVGCGSERTKNPELSFFEFPSGPPDRRNGWIRAVNREDPKKKGKLWIPSDQSLVCSLHFVSRRPSRLKSDVDYVPTVGVGREDVGTKDKSRKSYISIQEKKNTVEEIDCSGGDKTDGDDAEDGGDWDRIRRTTKVCQFFLKGPCDFNMLYEKTCQTKSMYDLVNFDVECDHDYCGSEDATFTDIRSRIDSLNAEIQTLQMKLDMCSARLKDLSIGASSMETFCDSDVKLYTGFPSFLALQAFYQGIEQEVDMVITIGDRKGTSCKISKMDQFILVLVRLRLGLLERDIAARFGISQSYVSKIFNTWIPFLSHCLQELHHFPTLEEIRPFMPSSFCEFPNTRFIIDCTELFIQRPSLAISQSQTWSSYKHHNTAKALVSITPDGFLSFVSRLFSGATSDREIVERSGFLDLVDVGDGVMADRGFNIDDLLIPLGATLNIPAFKGRDRTQLSYEEVFDSRRIASARIHVERVIGRIKNFNILNGIIPLSCVPLLNDIFLVCSYLVNYQSPVLKIE